MKEVAKHDRPREKLQRLGVAALGDNELVAIVLGSGSREMRRARTGQPAARTRGRTAWPDAHRAGSNCMRTGHRRRARGADCGGGRAGAPDAGAGTNERPRLPAPQQLACYLLPQYGAATVEQFGIVMLDTKHHVIRIKLLSIGSLDTTVVHPREVFKEATAASAAAIVLFHNHPSGDPTPSSDDLVLTTRMLRAGDIMGIDVIDHLILSDQRYFSLVEAGKLAGRVE